MPRLSGTPALAHDALAHYAVAHHAAGAGSTGAQNVSASSLLVQMVVALVVIVVLIKLASKFVQGRGRRTLGHGPRPHGVAVVGRQSLGKGVQVAMVAAGRQTYLLGVTQRQVTLLGQVETEDIAPAQRNDDDQGGLQLLRGGNRPGACADESLPVWKSAIEQMRVRTVRRA